ncbi:Lrp/AsnC family transcriptional regulator [Thalassospira sp.]|uniref:Lrp/AsnC family transcriptional regulator n=1 Tax=Thalassospira sp. TaxID=1912094 RepID=UPI003AA951D7
MDNNLTPIQRRLIDRFQHDFPLVSEPFARIAADLGSTETAVMDALTDLKAKGYLARIGATYATGRIGASTLAAMEVPETELEKVAAKISHFTEINHNYEREDKLNLWFVVTAADQAQLQATIQNIEHETGLTVHQMPMVEHYRLDLGFALQWN